MATWHADDGNAEVTYECETGREAAQQYVDDGDWGDRSETCWIEVHTWQEEEDEDGDTVRINERTYTITLEAEEPDCIDGHEHRWRTPYSLLGGLKENPGVWGHGGGVICNEVCTLCGCKKITDTWAQNPSNGEQGLTSVEYVEGEFTDEINARHIQRAKDKLETVDTEQTGEYDFEWLDDDGDQIGADDDDLREYGIALLTDEENASITGSLISAAETSDAE